MEAAILENTPGTRSKDSTLFRDIFREISRFVLSEAYMHIATGLKRWAGIPHEHGVFDAERQDKIQPRASQNEPRVLYLWASRDEQLQNYEMLIRGTNLGKLKIDKKK